MRRSCAVKLNMGKQKKTVSKPLPLVSTSTREEKDALQDKARRDNLTPGSQTNYSTLAKAFFKYQMDSAQGLSYITADSEPDAFTSRTIQDYIIWKCVEQPKPCTGQYAMSIYSALKDHYTHEPHHRGKTQYMIDEDGVSLIGNPCCDENLTSVVTGLKSGDSDRVITQASPFKYEYFRLILDYFESHPDTYIPVHQAAILLVFSMMFVCLLRIDEIQQIKFEDVFPGKSSDGYDFVELCLNKRKRKKGPRNFQFSRDKYCMDTSVVDHYARYIAEMHKFGVSFQATDYLIPCADFRNKTFKFNTVFDVKAVMVDLHTKGILPICEKKTHTFRRGGAQFYFMHHPKPWKLDRIKRLAEWSFVGGLTQLQRYLIEQQSDSETSVLTIMRPLEESESPSEELRNQCLELQASNAKLEASVTRMESMLMELVKNSVGGGKRTESVEKILPERKRQKTDYSTIVIPKYTGWEMALKQWYEGDSAAKLPALKDWPDGSWNANASLKQAYSQKKKLAKEYEYWGRELFMKKYKDFLHSWKALGPEISKIRDIRESSILQVDAPILEVDLATIAK